MLFLVRLIPIQNIKLKSGASHLEVIKSIAGGWGRTGQMSLESSILLMMTTSIQDQDLCNKQSFFGNI